MRELDILFAGPSISGRATSILRLFRDSGAPAQLGEVMSPGWIGDLPLPECANYEKARIARDTLRTRNGNLQMKDFSCLPEAVAEVDYMKSAGIVVLVLDSQKPRLRNNIERCNLLISDYSYLGIMLPPLILLMNKNDLPNLLTREEIQGALVIPSGTLVLESSAVHGLDFSDKFFQAVSTIINRTNLESKEDD